MRPPALGRALVHRDFRLLLGAFATSRAGDFLYTIALVVYVLEATGSSVWVSATVIVRVVPLVLGGSFAGLLADRVDRRRLMVLSDLLRALSMGAIALVAALDGPIVLVVVLVGVTTLAGMPYFPAFYASLPRLVPERELASANSLISTIECLSLVVGPGIGGLLVASASPAWAFTVNALTFVLSAVLVLRAKVPAAEDPEGDADTGTLAGMRLGVQTLTGDRVLGALVLSLLVLTFIYGFELVYLVLVARDLLGMGASGVGYLDAAVGVGGLLGAVVAPRLARSRRPRALIALILTLNAAPMAALAVVRSPVIALLVLAVEGVAALVLDVVVTTIMQRVVPGARLARVEGILASLSTATLLLGSLLAPVLLGLVGLRGSLVLASALPAGLALVMLARVRGLDEASAQRLDTSGPQISLLTSLDLLAGADPASVERIASAMEPVTFPAGTVMLSEGAAADHLLVLSAGSFVAYTAEHPEQQRQLTAPDYVGEIGLLQGRPRTATVRAVTEVSGFRVPGEEFLAAVGIGGGPSRALESRVAERLTGSFG
ncbi:MAG: MFS transporter [Sporichthyaceae bacterium]|nr:MFS transporter [Sporichthyaceae bacterium]